VGIGPNHRPPRHPWRGGGASRPAAGFSLVELLLTLAIVGVVAAVAAPRYANATERFRADSAARRLAADIAALRARARSLCASQSMTFTAAAANAGGYTVAGMPDPDHPSATYRVDLAAEPYRAAVTAATFTTTTGQASSTLTINGYGVPTAGGAVTIQVGATCRTVTVDANSGEVMIQ
jgi:prepilin-type N-terminal cleavage/methylation domain-containing protein